MSPRGGRPGTVLDVEAETARVAVDAASALCRDFLPRLLDADTVAKEDESPVTVADFAVQAVVSHVLSSALGDIRMIGEENVDDLRRPESAILSRRVVELVRRHVGASVSERDVFDSLALGSRDFPGERYWVLDPIDGTKGFLRGDQYAIALALIDDGDVVLGVLGCPNLPNSDGSTGATFVAVPGRCLVHAGTHTTARTCRRTGHTGRRRGSVESVESGHSNHGHASLIAERLGIAAPPFRIDSQCKYGAVARGDASIYLRLPTRAGYREKVWDHAAGKFIVEQAGGRVTDVTGASLDFSQGVRLDGNVGVIATDGRFHDQVVEVVQAVLG